MFLTIHPDGRTFRHDVPHDSELRHARGLHWACPPEAYASDSIAVPLAEDGLILWVERRTITHAEGLRNLPASLLMPQFGTPACVLAGTVVVTSSGSQASAFVEDGRWAHIEGLVEDITRASHGLEPIHGRGLPAAWASAVRLAAAVLDDIERVPAPAGADPYQYLMRDLTLGVTP